MDGSEEDWVIAGVPEILVNRSRVVVGQRGLKAHLVDDPGALSEDLGDIPSEKGFALEVNYQISKGGTRIRRKGDGQVGLIRREKIAVSPGSLTEHHAVLPVTAKRNLRRHSEHGIIKNVKDIYMQLMNADHEDVLMEFQDSNWVTSDITCEYGIGISVGRKIDDVLEGLTNVDYSYELVREDFKCERGMRVGISVFQSNAPTAETVSRNPRKPLKITAEELNTIFGDPGSVIIYTGTIMLADPGQPHIEYDINSFRSCSGAIVFLLDRNQPESVTEEDFGKAIAVHVGGHPTLHNRNIGFKLMKRSL